VISFGSFQFRKYIHLHEIPHRVTEKSAKG
jgi:hypothetical protein